jgi:hypothetical protein
MASVEVVALEYSGREDRSWRITEPTDLESLRQLLRNLPPSAEPNWPTLGPRGYLLINHGISGFPEEVRVFQGVIGISEGRSSRYFRDVHGLEDWLRSHFPMGRRVR